MLNECQLGQDQHHHQDLYAAHSELCFLFLFLLDSRWPSHLVTLTVPYNWQYWASIVSVSTCWESRYKHLYSHFSFIVAGDPGEFSPLWCFSNQEADGAVTMRPFLLVSFSTVRRRHMTFATWVERKFIFTHVFRGFTQWSPSFKAETSWQMGVEEEATQLI